MLVAYNAFVNLHYALRAELANSQLSKDSDAVLTDNSSVGGEWVYVPHRSPTRPGAIAIDSVARQGV